MLHKLGLNISKHPLATIAVWLVSVVLIGVIALGGVFGQSLFERLASSEASVSSDSSTADDILAGNSSEKTENLIMILRDTKVSNADAAKIITGMQEDFKDDRNVLNVTSPVGIPAEVLATQPALQGMISNDENNALVLVEVKQDGTAKENSDLIYSVEKELKPYITDLKDAGIETDVTAPTMFADQITHQASKDLEKGEIISLPLALIVLVLVFGGFLAAGMPLIGAIASILGGMGALFGFSYLMDIDTTVMNVLTIIGLGVSIDYGLLMISRYREILRTLPENGKETIHEAIAQTTHTAGRTVLFSGLTIAICTSALAVFEANIMKSVAVSAAAVILIAILSSLTLLPALFSLLGYKLIHPSPLTKVPGVGKFLKAFGDVAPEEGVFSRLAEKIQKAPAIIAAAGIALLLFLGSSVLSLHVSSYGTPPLASSTGQSALFDDLGDNYKAFEVSDLTLVIQGDTEEAITDKATSYETYLSNLSYITSLDAIKVTEGNDYGVITANVTDSAAGQDAVKEIRDYTVEQGDEGQVLLTGDSAKDVDFNNSLLSVAWIVIGLIALTTFVLLFLLTGSVFIPLKAIFLSALSLGASIGVITWGFEGGNLAGLLNFDASEIVGISPIILVLIVVFGFGLAMDYEVFLVSRIKEEYDKTGDNRLAIRKGLQGSGRIITSAGLIIVLVFLGFTLGDMLMIKQIGVALAVAVLVDMTIVRCILVPALMTLFGKWVWWTPKPLQKIYDKFKIEH
jgi:uncharacterized membrane protein YdfJ with MMPL/SSD domain